MLQQELRIGVDAVSVCRKLHRAGRPAMLLEGAAWDPGPLLAIDPEVEAWHRPEAVAALGRLAGEIGRRRRTGGEAETGVGLLLSYELFGKARPEAGDLPDLVAWRVDRSLRFLDDGGVRWSARAPGPGAATILDRLERPLEPGRPARGVGRPGTSLPREAYLGRVERIRRHIAAGDIYQANLCQRIETRYEGDELDCYARLAAGAPGPRSAFLCGGRFALASISPETFLRLRPPGRVETHPIKGTRPRGSDAQSDRAAARELLASAKDRAELLMIVDLERNDLGRVCKPGTVRTTELAGLRSFPTVHHLVGRVEGVLRDEVGIEELLRATFPGGSITGAPKLRAMQILAGLEPVRRNYFTGCLFWFGDDGGMESSILIRTLVFERGRAMLGAGGGIVADSDPEQEWLESNHKARALAAALGFDPAEASS